MGNARERGRGWFEGAEGGGRGQHNIRSDIKSLSNLLLLVGVDFRERNLAWSRELLRELLVHGGDGFAWSAPVCVDYEKGVSALLRATRMLGTVVDDSGRRR